MPNEQNLIPMDQRSKDEAESSGEKADGHPAYPGAENGV